ncbi:MAG: DDE-type integrase/transposase/recombinase [Candidatus Eremiobacteraeota bacterium]|nr:DDE-type integrase/transposase/recombinase [Candidatus Eremiobacteraeota bacterium]
MDPNDDNIDARLWEAAWRFQLIAPLVNPELSEDRKREHRSELLARMAEHPFRGPVTLKARTLRRWCKNYREEGLAGLVTRKRLDLGVLRALPTAALERALELRDEDGRRSVPQLIRLLEAEEPGWKDLIARSSLDRHLRARGSKRELRRPEGPFRTFEADYPNQLWQGDVLHGPLVRLGDGERRCKVVCWLDDHARYACHLEAYADERLPSIENSLKKAVLKYGLPCQLFVDNALVYSGKAFSLACSHLGIHKIHSTPRYPVSRGKQERFFKSLREQVLIEVENLEALSLEQLNRYLVAWVDNYHRTRHSRTGQTPLERFSERRSRYVPVETLEEAFWQWDSRAVSSTGEIKFAGNVYQADPSFAGRKKMVIRYDPYDLSQLYLWQEGRRVGVAVPQQLIHQTRPGRPHRPRGRDSQAAQRYLDGLEKAHQARRLQELNLTQFPNEEES